MGNIQSLRAEPSAADVTMKGNPVSLMTNGDMVKDEHVTV